MDPNREEDRNNIDPLTLKKGKKYDFQYGEKGEMRIIGATFSHTLSRQPNPLFSLVFSTKDPETLKKKTGQYEFSYISHLRKHKPILQYIIGSELGKRGGIKNGLSLSKRKTGRKSIKKRNNNRTFRKLSK